MSTLKLVCENCGGNLVLDNSHEIGICEYCLTQYVIKQDQIIQRITQNITKYVYGYEGKDIEELLTDAYKLMELNDDQEANTKFKKALDIEPNCWSAWLGYAETGGNRNGYISMVPAYQKSYQLASNEKERMNTFISMLCYLPNQDLRSAYIRAYNVADFLKRDQIFNLVVGVIGRDESEMATLAIDLCPNDWRAYFVYAKYRQIRAKWAELEGGLFSKKHLPKAAIEVLNIFLKTYELAKTENKQAENIVISYIENLEKDSSYKIFAQELKKKIIE